MSALIRVLGDTLESGPIPTNLAMRDWWPQPVDQGAVNALKNGIVEAVRRDTISDGVLAVALAEMLAQVIAAVRACRARTQPCST